MHHLKILFLFIVFGLVSGCGNSFRDSRLQGENDENVEEPVSLKSLFEDHFLMGAAVNSDQFNERDERGNPIIEKHYNTITPENVLKWQSIQPEEGDFRWADPDKYVAFGEKHDMFIIGHTLVWHNQTPDWVFQDDEGNPAGRETLLERMRDHIHTLVGRYKGRVHGWDVVNEALNEDGSLRQSPWLEIIGPEYIEKAFEFANEADPDAELYYNDYSLADPDKRAGAIQLIKNLQYRGIPVTGIGMQAHYNPDGPAAGEVATSITQFANLGIDVMITELDINVVGSDQGDPYAEGLPATVQQELAGRYQELFEVFMDRSDHITRITFWGVTDGDSWLNYFNGNRTNYPLLFDREGQPKPAFHAVIDLMKE